MHLFGSRAIAVLVFTLAGSALAQDRPLRLLTWADYVPPEVKTLFEKETGYKVELTVANNDEMISKLRTSSGPAFDLAQPSLDRIVAAQRDFKIYKPFDLAKLKTELFIAPILAASRKNSTLEGKVYGVPHMWGTDGLVVNTKLAKIGNYPDLCKPEYKRKTSLRLKRPALLAFAFAAGKDPFALYNNPKGYAELMDGVGKTLLACKANVRYFWDNKDQALSGMRGEELVGAMMWDIEARKLNNERPEIQYVAPKSGALGWIDTYALPARGENEVAAYAWINFNLRADIAAKVANAAATFTAAVGAEQLMDAKLKAQFAAGFSGAALNNIKWYPAVPPGVEEIEDRVLERIRAAN